MAKKAIYSGDLGIDLRSRREVELFKWFLACLLFGKPIQQDVARRTYFEFVNEGLLTPDAILRTGWDKLVEVLDRGHYVRYDFSTATKLLEISKSLKDQYGTLTCLLEQVKNWTELSQRLQSFKGIGPVTARIFLRDIKKNTSFRFGADSQRRRSSRSAARAGLNAEKAK
jgi:endonuclease III